MSSKRIIPVSVSLLVTALYWVTRTDVHTFDALSYILDVMRKPWNELFHPHHLAYGPFGALMVAILGGSAEHALQHANAIAGGLGAGVFTAIILRRYQRIDLALIAGIALSVSYAYWYYAIEVEVYTVAALFLLCIIWFLDQPMPHRWQWQFGLGLSIAGAVLFHQTNALLVVPLLIAMIYDIRHNPDHRIGWVISGVSAVTVVGVAYAYVMFVVSGFTDWSSAQRWLFQYAITGWWGGQATIDDVVDGISQTIAWSYGTLIGVITLMLSIWQLHKRTITFDAWHRWCWSWIIVYVGFFTWWEPDNIEFWIAVTPLFIMALIAPLRHTTPWGWSIRGFIVLAACTFYTNYAAIDFRGNAQNDLQRDIARAVATQSTVNDLLLIPDGLQELYMPFYHQREHFMSINATMAQMGNWQMACDELQRAIDRSQRAGARIIVASDFLMPTDTMQKRFGLTATAVKSCFQQLMPVMQPMKMPKTVPEHLQINAPAEQLATGMWRTDTMPLLGWQTMNMEIMQRQLPWMFRAGLDPNLTSPILNIPLPRYMTIEIEVRDSADMYAQLFVSDTMNIFSEALSIGWELQAGRHSYTIDLHALPNKPSRLVQFRLDPVADGMNGVVILYGISIE